VIRPLPRVVLVTLRGLALVVGLPVTATAQGQFFFMQALDGAGRPVLDLSPEEVEVVQGDTSCRTESLLLETGGMKIALLVENSAQSANSLNALRDGVQAFLTALGPEHEVALITIAGQVRFRVPFTTDRAKLAEEAGRLFVETGTVGALVDGFIETWDRRFTDEDPWPVFVVVGYDGPDASGGRKERQFNNFVVEFVSRGGTAHVVLNATQGEALPRQVGQNVAQNSGGSYNALAAATGMTKVLTDLAGTMGTNYEQLKHRYRVAVACRANAGSINVKVTRPGVGIRLYADRRPANR